MTYATAPAFDPNALVTAAAPNLNLYLDLPLPRRPSRGRHRVLRDQERRHRLGDLRVTRGGCDPAPARDRHGRSRSDTDADSDPHAHAGRHARGDADTHADPGPDTDANAHGHPPHDADPPPSPASRSSRSPMPRSNRARRGPITARSPRCGRARTRTRRTRPIAATSCSTSLASAGLRRRSVSASSSRTPARTSRACMRSPTRPGPRRASRMETPHRSPAARWPAAPPPTIDAYVDIDLPAGSVTGNGRYAFALKSNGTDSLLANSRESSTGRPQLVIDGGGSPPPPPVPVGAFTANPHDWQRPVERVVHRPVDERPDGVVVDVRRPGIGEREHVDAAQPVAHVRQCRFLRRHAHAVECRGDRAAP